MGLETATYIHQLDPSNPVGGEDPKGQGDDHIRMMKDCMLNTLPNVEGPVSASHTELSYCTGVTSPIQTQLDTKAAAAAFASGVYTPTPSAVLNCTISSADEHHYSKVGRIVTVSGAVTISVTNGAGIETECSIGIPIVRDTNFSDAFMAIGVGSTVNVNGNTVVRVRSVGGDQRASIQFRSTQSGTTKVYYVFQYQLEEE